MEIYTNHCVLKTCGLDLKELKKVVATVKDKTLQIECKEENLIGSIFIVNNNADSTKFQDVVTKLLKKLKNNIYADKDIDIEQALVELLFKKGYSISTAESITAGLVSSKITRIKGASKVFYEGLVVYDSRSKLSRLHIQYKTIEKYGAISKETVKEMLDGLLTNKDIDFALATVGVAGPDITENKKPGYAVIGVANRNEKEIIENNFTGTRNEVREKVANYAIFRLISMLKKY